MKPLHRKILYVVLWYLVYPQLWYLYLIPELFFDPENLLSLSAILITYLVGLIDTYFRPFSESIRGDLKTNPVYNFILLGLFILNPLLVILAFHENRLLIAGSLPFWDNPVHRGSPRIGRPAGQRRCEAASGSGVGLRLGDIRQLDPPPPEAHHHRLGTRAHL